MRCTKAVFMTLCVALSLEARVQADYIYTTLTPPGSFGTWAYGINDQGDIVGSYNTSAGAGQYGFVLSNGVFTTIENGPFLSVTVTGINNAGSIIGFYAFPSSATGQLQGGWRHDHQPRRPRRNAGDMGLRDQLPR